MVASRDRQADVPRLAPRAYVWQREQSLQTGVPAHPETALRCVYRQMSGSLSYLYRIPVCGQIFRQSSFEIPASRLARSDGCSRTGMASAAHCAQPIAASVLLTGICGERRYLRGGCLVTERGVISRAAICWGVRELAKKSWRCSEHGDACRKRGRREAIDNGQTAADTRGSRGRVH